MQESKHTQTTCKQNHKTYTDIPKEKLENTRHVHMSQNPNNWILITQNLTYPKHQKSKTMFTLEPVPNLVTLSYLGQVK